ncbi:MAG: hypothetical protein HOK62_01660 [Verrucomicrobiales bacterium]|jgi:hypothetical protein|nr:hypothetical protein [Verrucomicrobiales bacterium]
MLKKCTKYAATAFAVASLSTFMIGCGGENETSTALPEPAEVLPDDPSNLTTDPPEIPATNNADNP